MNQNNSVAVSIESRSLGGKSWTAYVRVVLIGIVLLVLATPFAWAISATAGVVVLLLSLPFVAYKILYLKSFHLYFDDAGVWVFSGVLPWNKGILGVKWRDLDEATYDQSLGSWLFKSYSIRIGHRFSKSREIFLSHWSRGDEAVLMINGQHQGLVRAGVLR